MKAAYLLGILLLAAGCESDMNKLERLEREAAFSRLDVLRIQHAIEDSPGAVDLRDSLRAAQARRTLAERDLNRFLR